MRYLVADTAIDIGSEHNLLVAKFTVKFERIEICEKEIRRTNRFLNN